MRLKWFGTATILLEHDGAQLLFDPFISLNENAYKPVMGELSDTENILVTHGHLDHIADIPAILSHGCGRTKVYCTGRPRGTLLSKGVPEKSIKLIAPGDVLALGPFEVDVLKGKHIVIDRKLKIRTVISPRILTNWSKVMHIRKENKICTEGGETVAYYVKTQDKKVLLLGSLNLDENTVYPQDADLLILPLQGRSDINVYAMQIIDRLLPKRVLLDHFDDSFPPISSSVSTAQFISLMSSRHPGVPVICPQAGDAWIAAE